LRSLEAMVDRRFTQMRRSFAGARRAYKGGRTSFDEYRRVRNDYYCHIRKAKQLAWERFLEGVFPTDDHSELASDPKRSWRALRYTKPQVPLKYCYSVGAEKSFKLRRAFLFA
jgi:hypothetical protein